jgi:CheY-like chemotaxis protein
VDDDPLVLSNIVALLDDLGHRVIPVSTALDAVDAFTRNPTIELLISDQLMPEMTGLQLIDALRAVRPSLPAILATGFAELQDDLDASVLRLAKPYTQQQLKAAVETCMRAADRDSHPPQTMTQNLQLSDHSVQ